MAATQCLEDLDSVWYSVVEHGLEIKVAACRYVLKPNDLWTTTAVGYIPRPILFQLALYRVIGGLI